MEGDLDDDSEDEDAEAVHGSEVVTMAELQEEFTDGDAEAIEQQAMLELSMLPRERQQHIAAGFRNMVDRVKFVPCPAMTAAK